MKAITNYAGGALSILLSGITAVQLSQEWVPCLILLGTGVLVGLLSLLFYEDEKLYFYCLLASSIIIIGFAVYGLISINEQKQGDVVWEEHLERINVDPELERLKTLADENDGPAQYELSQLYLDRLDYRNALKYAQKSADNGNGQAYIQLVQMYYNGMGDKIDIHQAVSNMVEAQKRDRISFAPMLEDISDQLSSDEKARLQDSERVKQRSASICSAIVDALNQKGDKAAIEMIKSSHAELEALSMMGNLPATECLYLEEAFKMEPDTVELDRLTRVLYRSNHLPDSPVDRAFFFSFMDGEKAYSDEDFMTHIQNRNFAFLSKEGMKFMRAAEKGGIWDESSDEHLLRDYQLFRAQYEEMKKLTSGERSHIHYVLFHGCDYNELERDAKSLLESNIVAIKKRMREPGKTESDSTRHYYISHSLIIR